MRTQTRTNQGGSVVSFLVVGVVLAAVVFGAIYLVQKRGDTPTPEPTPSGPVIGQSDQPQPSGSPASPSPSATPSGSPRPSSQPGGQQPAPSTDLPATGPADDLVLLALPIALLVASIVAYSRSRRLATPFSHR